MRRFFLCIGIVAIFGVPGPPTFGGTAGRSSSETRSARGARSASKVPTFTLDQAIITSLQQNPTLLNAEQEIKRSRGVIIQVRAQALPQINANANFQWIDPNLTGARVFGNTSPTSGFTPSGTTAGALMEWLPSPVSDVRAHAAPAATPGVTNLEASHISYA